VAATCSVGSNCSVASDGGVAATTVKSSRNEAVLGVGADGAIISGTQYDRGKRTI
jgi:hypothetical protein